MNLNLTLLVQALHFFIAYMLIERLLFKPVLKAMNDDEEQLHTLRVELEAEKTTMQEIKHTKEIKWQECRAYFALHRPVHELPARFVTEQSASIKPVVTSPSVLENAKRSIVSTVVNKAKEA